MGIKSTRAGLMLALAALALPVGLSNAHAAATVPVATWQLNEGAGATSMADSSGHGINGVIQAQSPTAPKITTGVSLDAGNVGYRWSNVQPNQPPATPERVIQIADNALNPGTRDWKISFRYRTSRPFGNIMQKGQSTTNGGQIKFQLPQGNVSCMYKGASGARRSVRTVGAYDDNLYHVVTCERLASGVTLKVFAADGVTLQETRKINGATGNISNTVPMTIGGKINCNQMDITCDYFAGDIDWVKVESS